MGRLARRLTASPTWRLTWRLSWRLARRLAWAVLVVFGVASVSFAVTRSLPGDPARLLLGPQASHADVERARTLYALDASLPVQFERYWRRLIHRAAVGDEHTSCAEPIRHLHIDLGYSHRYRKPVAQLLAEKAPRSFELALGALLVQLVLGIGLGAFAAKKRGTRWDDASIAAVLLTVSAPTFVLGLGLQYVFAHRLGWLPHDGYGTTPSEHLLGLILPALTLGIHGAAFYARLTREELGHALAADYVRTARGKGASELRALFVHALRNAVVPIATLMVLDFGTLVGGAIVTEKLFRWPGLGAMTVEAVVNRDAALVMAMVLFSATAIVAASVVLDSLTHWLDRRREP
ncbi:MAG: ABC transporter permease [Myxococcales bacterium]|nr:ABC transporter permease [Myxococcales bacterium]